MEQISTPYAYYRGGTSKAALVLASDLPTSDPSHLDAWILAIYGSPDRRQIDGIGGADILTSKFAVVGPASRPDADVDYTFFQVDIRGGAVMRSLNCGNISAAIGPFAIDEGLVAAVEPRTEVRIHATNFGKMIYASVPVRDGKARVLGDEHIDGVPGTGARIDLDFRDTAGGVSGQLLPTGNALDRIAVEGLGEIEMSIVDLANLVCYVRAEDLGLRGNEDPQRMSEDTALMDCCERIRIAAAVRLGLIADAAAAEKKPLSTPWLGIVSRSQDWTDFATSAPHRAAECDITARLFTRRNVHKTYPGTGSACIGVAAKIPGTLVHAFASEASAGVDRLRIGHPCGVLEVDARVSLRDGASPVVERASFPRTARRLADGRVYAATDRLPWLQESEE